MMRTFSLLTLSFALSGCLGSGTRFTDQDFCQLAMELKPHRLDTPKTQKQLDTYRQFYRKQCPDGKWQ
jgi:hypothetical protein